MSFFSRRKPSVQIRACGQTDTGQQREHNEDAFLVADLSTGVRPPADREYASPLGTKGALLLVADGMGGAAAGEVASNMAAHNIFDYLVGSWGKDRDDSPEQFALRLREAVEAANDKIHEHALQNPARRGMGTTVTAVGVLKDELYLTQVGDSRAYVVRDGEATLITKDQSLMQRLVDAGELTEEEAEKSERRNIILQALGPDAKVKVDLTHHPLRQGDAVVICSDGLSGQVGREEIGEAVAQNGDLAAACAQLITLANERGGPDNITVIVAQFEGDLKTAGPSGDTVRHRAFPLVDADSETETFPVAEAYSEEHLAADRRRMIVAAVASALIILLALLVAA